MHKFKYHLDPDVKKPARVQKCVAGESALLAQQGSSSVEVVKSHLLASVEGIPLETVVEIGV